MATIIIKRNFAWKISVACFMVLFSLSSSALAIDADIYEEDNSPDQARLIIVNSDEPQHHTFYRENEDWLVFEGTKDSYYTIELSNPGANCDAKIYLYNSDDQTNSLKEQDSGSEGDPESLVLWLCPITGYYYVKIENRVGTFDNSTEYDIHVIANNAPLLTQGRIYGYVYDASSNDRIVGATINIATIPQPFISSGVRNELGIILSGNLGFYSTPLIEGGTYILTVSADGYNTPEPYSINFNPQPKKENKKQEIYMTPVTPGFPLTKKWYKDGDGNGKGSNIPPSEIRCKNCAQLGDYSGYVDNDYDDNPDPITATSTSLSELTTTSTSTTVPTTTSTSTTVSPTTSTTVAPTTTTISTTSTTVPTTTTSSTTTTTVPTTTTSSTTSTTVPTTTTSTTVPTTTTTTTLAPTTTTSTSTTVPPTTSTIAAPTTTTSSTTTTTLAPTTTTTSTTSTTVPTTTSTSTTVPTTTSTSTTVPPTTTTTLALTTTTTSTTSTTLPTTTSTSTTVPPTTSTTAAPTTTTSSTTTTTLAPTTTTSTSTTVPPTTTTTVAPTTTTTSTTSTTFPPIPDCNQQTDEKLLLCNAISILKGLTGGEMRYCCDINGDGKGGLEEVVYILRKATGEEE